MAKRVQFVCQQIETSTVELVVPDDADLDTVGEVEALSRAEYRQYSPSAWHTVGNYYIIEEGVDDLERDI